MFLPELDLNSFVKHLNKFLKDLSKAKDLNKAKYLSKSKDLNKSKDLSKSKDLNKSKDLSKSKDLCKFLKDVSRIPASSKNLSSKF